jgi:hypothetical protein
MPTSTDQSRLTFETLVTRLIRDATGLLKLRLALAGYAVAVAILAVYIA